MESFNFFIARRGEPDKIYSDNAKTFVAAAKRLRKILEADEFHDYLARNKVKWQLNLSKAPWRGGQYERLIGLVKKSLYKVLGRSMNYDEGTTSRCFGRRYGFGRRTVNRRREIAKASETYSPMQMCGRETLDR